MGLFPDHAALAHELRRGLPSAATLPTCLAISQIVAQANTPTSYDLHARLVIAHAILASLAVLLLLPTGILIARLCRSHPSWLHYHTAVQSLFLFLFTGAFLLGTAAVAIRLPDEGLAFVGPEADLHHSLGLACFVLVLAQVALGVWSHKVRPYEEKSGRKPWVRKVHVAGGIGIAILSYIVTYKGMVVEWGAVTNNGTVTPRGVRIVFWVLLAIPVAIYSVAVMRMLALKLRTREQLDELDEKMVELEETDPDSKLDEAYDKSYCSSRT